MKPNIFMSYSRREVGFVDDLTHKLEKNGYKVWLDYRTLVPGTPWKGQIDAGLNDSDTVLLVVSKASIASKYVELEWRHFLKLKKRLILLIFEAVDLPKELEVYEWVDFRSGVRNLDAMAQLLPEPAKLLAALGIRPLGNQLVLPSIIMAMRYFIMLLGVFSAGAIVNYLLDFYDAGFDLVLSSQQAVGIVLGFILNLLLIGALAFFSIRHLVTRKGWLASLRNFIISLVALGVLIFSLLIVDDSIFTALDSMGEAAETSPAVLYPIYIYIIGGIVLAFFLFLRRQDVRPWFPAKVKKNK